MCELCDAYDQPDDIPEGHVLCPRCGGHQTVPCRCGGDQCYCGEEDTPCPMCGGEYGSEGYVPKERADRYHARQREIHDAFHQKPDHGRRGK